MSFKRQWDPVMYSEPRICKPFKEPRNRFPAWRAGTTILFDVGYRPARLHRLAESLNGFLGSLNVYNYGLWTILSTEKGSAGLVFRAVIQHPIGLAPQSLVGHLGSLTVNKYGLWTILSKEKGSAGLIFRAVIQHPIGLAPQSLAGHLHFLLLLDTLQDKKTKNNEK